MMESTKKYGYRSFLQEILAELIIFSLVSFHYWRTKVQWYVKILGGKNDFIFVTRYDTENLILLRYFAQVAQTVSGPPLGLRLLA